MWDHSHWSDLLGQYSGRAKYSDPKLCYYALARDIIELALREADEAWNARILIVEDAVDQFSSQIYDNPSDIVSSDHLWALSQYLSEIYQAINSQIALMGMIQERLQRYAAEQAELAPAMSDDGQWAAFSQGPWLEALTKSMTDYEQLVHDGLIKEVDRLLDRVNSTNPISCQKLIVKGI